MSWVNSVLRQFLTNGPTSSLCRITPSPILCMMTVTPEHDLAQRLFHLLMIRAREGKVLRVLLSHNRSSGSLMDSISAFSLSLSRCNTADVGEPGFVDSKGLAVPSGLYLPLFLSFRSGLLLFPMARPVLPNIRLIPKRYSTRDVWSLIPL